MLGRGGTAVHQAPTEPTEQVTVSFTSDPSGAHVYVDDSQRGTTPLKLEVAKGKAITYVVEAKEPYPSYNLYKPYQATLTPSQGRGCQRVAGPHHRCGAAERRRRPTRPSSAPMRSGAGSRSWPAWI